MKKLLMCLVGLLLLSSAAAAQNATIGLFADQDVAPAPAYESHCVTGEGLYTFEMWIWCRPSADGQMCAEFMLSYPANVITSTVTANVAIVSVSLGDLSTGMSVCFKTCQNTWLWCFHQLIYVTNTDVTTIDIMGHPENGGRILFADCREHYPLSEVPPICGMQLNTAPEDCFDPTGTEDSSWGAIKSLYR